VQKKSGFVLAALALFAFALVSSPAAPAIGAALQPTQAIQAAPAPVVSPVLAPVQSPLEPAAAFSPANGATQPVWLSDDTRPGVGRPVCRCSKNSQCGTGGACCWWPHQTCGICC
jgi:hypothetical protein